LRWLLALSLACVLRIFYPRFSRFCSHRAHLGFGCEGEREPWDQELPPLMLDCAQSATTH
jgi:hypothetical protein